MAAHMDILRHLVIGCPESKSDTCAFGAGGVKKKMRAADNLTGKSVGTDFKAGISFAAA